MFISVLASILQLSLIVLAHELGHYFFAKISGTRVLGFNLGFGPRLWSIQHNGTQYAVRLILIGGYVQLADGSLGELDASIPAEQRFENKSWLARFAIMIGGTLFNLLFAWAVFYGLYLTYHHWAVFTAFGKSFLALGQLLKEFLREIILLFVRRDFSGLSGSVGILSFSAESLRQGWPVFWQFTALLSINLGILNLLPFPALDGGRIIFLLYELIFRRKPDPRFESYVHLFGFIFLFALIILVSFQDVLRL
ncbi:regulator of sigma E protease [Candidatus Termititenax dinenymphae]|uniref:Regulator of sigma E protease n=1 Tax=Candidatus Termititenax dinenymphae TaxID=2218523 RepID=A0A388TJ59_9BACT|nr:regulator of sigma E protease [Candidatus Termititenax dinenymphae]